MALRLYYANVPNMGDLLNRIIVERIFNTKVVRTPLYASQMIAIGSGMNALLKSPSTKGRIKQKVLSLFSDGLHVWGTGFIKVPDSNSQFFRKNITFHSVRGAMSKEYLEKILNKKLNIGTGDAGLLANYLFNDRCDKKYKLGVIPHFRQQSNPIFKELYEKYDNSVLIDLREEPMEVINKIRQCEYIVSSSLHGLIVADSFNIPNIHLNISSNLKGDGFKFADYYSSFGLNHNQLTPSDLNGNLYNKIIDNYQLNEKIIDMKRKEIMDSYPFK